MRLQRQQILPQARIKKVAIALGADEHKVTLEIQTALTKEVAESFGCRELIYVGDVPRSGVEKMDLEGSEIDCDVHLEHDSFAFQTVCEKMGKYVAKLEGDGPKLVFRLTFKGYVITVADLIEHVKIDPIKITLKPAQMDLGLAEEGVAEESERIISESQAEDTKGADEDGPSLAPAALVGGTHQRGTKQARGRRAPVPIDGETEDPEEEDVVGTIVQ